MPRMWEVLAQCVAHHTVKHPCQLCTLGGLERGDMALMCLLQLGLPGGLTLHVL